MNTPLHIYIGYDSREPDAWEVCAESLRRHTSIPLAISALKQDRLRERGLYKRPVDEPASTEFAHTRFLVPHLLRENKAKWGVFVDCDFLFTRDIAEVWKVMDRKAAVNLVKHDYMPKSHWKMDGQPQKAYPCKNWSSFMIFNAERIGTFPLNPEYINSSRTTPSDLHQFKWADPEDIHGLPHEWNWLEGEYSWPLNDACVDRRREPPAAIHYTNGGPWFEGCMGVAYADLWTHALAEIRRKQGQ